MELYVKVIKTGVGDTAWDVGDVIAVKPDGYDWGAKEISHPSTLIVSFVGDPDRVGELLSEVKSQSTGYMTRRRNFRYDPSTQEFVNKDNLVRTHRRNVRKLKR